MVMILKSGKAVKLTIFWSQMFGDSGTSMKEGRYKPYDCGILESWLTLYNTMLWIITILGIYN